MSRTRRAVLGFVTDTAGSAIVFIGNIAIAPLILAKTNAALYGFWITAMSILSYLTFADMGVGFGLVRSMAGIANRNDAARINAILATGFWIFCTGAVIFCLIGFSASDYIPIWLKIPEQGEVVASAFRVAVISGAIAFATTPFSSIVVGFQHMATDNMVKTVSALVGLVLSVALLLGGQGLMALAIATLGAAICSFVLSVWFARRYHPRLSVSLAHVNRSELTGLFRFGGYFQLCKVSNTVALNSDSVVISSALGAEHVPVYTFTSKLATLFSVAIAGKLPNASFPAIAQMYASGDYVGLQSAFIRLSAYGTRLACVGACVYALCNRAFVTLWVGPEQFGGVLLTAVFCLWVLQDSIFRGTVTVIYATNDLRRWSFACLIEAALNLSLSIWLVHEIGIIGVAVGTVVSKACSTMWVLPMLVCRKFRFSLNAYIRQGILGPILWSIPGVAATAALVWAIPSNVSWPALGCVGAVAGLTNLLCFEGRERLKRRSPSEVTASG